MGSNRTIGTTTQLKFHLKKKKNLRTHPCAENVSDRDSARGTVSDFTITVVKDIGALTSSLLIPSYPYLIKVWEFLG